MKQYGLPFIPPHELSGLAADTPLLLGFSGGADSRALLDLLVRYRESTGAPLFAAHVNHMIRGDEAVRDMRFACETAATAGVHCFTLCADVPALAKQRGQGLELTARQVRYEFFGRIMAENGIPVLVTAHNADDRLETLLFNIARGCGLGGLCAIPPRRPFGDGVLIRPLINAPKADIVAYCRERGLALVSLIAPTSHQRISMIAREAEGFVYCVSSLGVTGVRSQITTDVGAMVRLVKQANPRIPCAVGFGLSSPEQARSMAAVSDGAIVGSAIVKLCAQYGAGCVAPVADYVRAMKAAVSESGK